MRKDEEFRGPPRHPALAKHQSHFLFLGKPAREFRSMGFGFRVFCAFGVWVFLIGQELSCSVFLTVVPLVVWTSGILQTTSLPR